MKPIVIWAVLVIATLASWLVVERYDHPQISATAVIIIAAVKINLVVAYFMELPWSARPYRHVITAWIAGVTAIIIGGYWLI